jgi:uncharacterized protein (UPF0371 family)
VTKWEGQKRWIYNDKYLEQQTSANLGRVNRFNHKLYSNSEEDPFIYHAAGASGFDPNVKMRLLQMLKR